MSEALPITIAEWPRSKKEMLRVRLDQFKGVNTIDVRSWYINESTGAVCPGRSGITLAVTHLENLASSLARAVLVANERGIIGNDGGES